MDLQRFEEAKSLMRKTMPVAQRVLGEGNEFTLKTQWSYARALLEDDRASVDDLREAATRLEELERTARRVLGASHPIAVLIGRDLKKSRLAHKAWYSSKALVVLFAVAGAAWLWRFLT